MIDILSNVATKGYAPREWQSPFPRDQWGFKAPVGMSPDLARILSLPRRMLELDGTPRAETIIDTETERHALPPKRGGCMCAKLDPERYKQDGCIKRLRLVQAVALREARICGGLAAPIGVGHGKTIIDLLAPYALMEHGRKLMVLLVPPSLCSQLVSDYRYIGQHFRVPRLQVHHVQEYSCTQPGDDAAISVDMLGPLVHVVPYSRLRHFESSAWLESILHPEALLADECHHLRNVDSAGGGRVARYMDAHPETLFVGQSGSFLGKKIAGIAHLFGWALRGGSPLPTDPKIVFDWARAIDPQDNPAEPGALMYLCSPGEHITSGFHRRIVETIGVVTTKSPPVDVELVINERPAPALPPSILLALNGDKKNPDLELRRGARDGRRPDGEELPDSLSQSKCCRELASGFYYKWIFPHNKFPDDEPLVKEWREARKDYHKEVRELLKDRSEHLDSPLLAQNAAERAYGERPANKGLPVWKSAAYPRWRQVRDKVEPETATVWLDDFLVRDVAAWAAEAPGIVWYEHEAFARRLEKIAGIPVYGGGAWGGGLLSSQKGEEGRIVEDGSRSIALSIKAHGTGRNGLQHRYHRQLIVMLPTAEACEQTLGRLHRIGQTKAVQTWFYRHTDEMANHVDDVLRTALFIEGTLGQEQKLRMGWQLE